MRIYVYTRGREHRQITLSNLSDAVLKKTTLLCHPLDGKHELPPNVLANLGEEVTYPRRFKMLGEVREWLAHSFHDIEKYGPNFVMMDDDFSFLVRKPAEPTHFRAATRNDTTAIFRRIEQLLWNRGRGYAQVGLVARQAQHLNPDKLLVENTRIAGVLGFNAAILRKHNVRFDRLPTMTDFDSCLQLLRLGYSNAMICDYAYGQPGSNTEGGCSVYRTLELQAEGARGLARLHPGFVKVTERETVGSWGGGVRTDVTVYWRKAAKEGNEQYALSRR